MAIKIVEDGPAIVMTRSEYTKALREYNQAMAYMIDPPSLEEWLRARQADEGEQKLREILGG